ncbi:MAG TPA: response regulator [Planctomycetaceae bacterium]|nr:response regulator [Planctomycetaceae bacterium]
MRILVVDDHADLAMSTGKLLELLGYEVRTALDGHSAIEAAIAFLPHAILLDVGMPRLSGLDVARQIRQAPALKSVVLVAITGYGDALSRRKIGEAGFDHFLLKPCDTVDLTRILDGI